MKKVACLARVSTLDQHTSIDNQQDLFDGWIKRNKGTVLYKVYSDEGISGAKGYKRKQWLQMLEDGEQKKFDILLAKSYSRFGRNQRETLDVIARLRSKGIRIIFIEDSLDSDRDSNKFGLFAWLAEQEAQKTSERIKTVWESYNQQGKVHVCLAPYGYRYNKEIKNFEVDIVEAELVKRVFNLYIQGNGFSSIAKILTDEGVATKRGGKWGGNTISNILKNDFCIGVLTQGKTETMDVTMDTQIKVDKDSWYKHYNHHEAIISEDIFYKVQEEIQKRSTKAKSAYRNIDAQNRHSNKSLFSNIIICGDCGSAMSVRRRKNLRNYKEFYQCIQYNLYGKVGCGHSSNFIYQDILTDYIKEKLDKLVYNNFKELKSMLSSMKDEDEQKVLEKELKVVNQQLEKQTIIANKLVENLVNGLITDVQYKLQNDSISSNINALVRRREEINKYLDTLDTFEEKEENLKNGIGELLDSSVELWNNAMMKSIIESISVFTDGTIDIRFKYLNNQ